MIAFLIALAFSQSAFAKREFVVPGELLVQFRDGISTSKRSLLLENRSFRRMRGSKIMAIKLRKGESIDQALSAYISDPTVLAVQPNYRYYAFKSPNDPRYGQYWGLKNVGQRLAGFAGTRVPGATNNPGMSGYDIAAEGLWDGLTDCSAVTVAVVDTGINYRHEDLAGNMWNGGPTYPKHGFNFVDSNNDPLDRNGHGTHVAGTIGAVGDNNIGGTGICWKAKLMAVRVLGEDGSGTTQTVAAGIRFAADQGARIINLSLGGRPSPNAAQDTLFLEAIQYAGSKGVLVVAAAGNDGDDIEAQGKDTYPCSWSEPNLFCVAAIDQKFALASFSNFGKTRVHIAAPGYNVLSSVAKSQTTDVLATGWTFSGDTPTWNYGDKTYGSTNYALLSAPNGYNAGNTVSYSPASVISAAKQFDLSGEAVSLNYYEVSHLPANKSARFRIFCSKPEQPEVLLRDRTTSAAGTPTLVSLDLSACATANATVRFEFTAPNVAGETTGAAILLFSIGKLSPTSMDYLDGTSMSAPHGTGVAAALFAFNPGFGVADVVKAMLAGGITVSSLENKVSSGRALNAAGALSHVAKITGISIKRLQ